MDHREFLNKVVSRGKEKMDDVEAFLVKQKNNK